MGYNHATKRLIVVGYSYEFDFCGDGNASCNFVTLLENDNLDLKWSITFDAL